MRLAVVRRKGMVCKATQLAVSPGQGREHGDGEIAIVIRLRTRRSTGKMESISD